MPLRRERAGQRVLVDREHVGAVRLDRLFHRGQGEAGERYDESLPERFHGRDADV